MILCFYCTSCAKTAPRADQTALRCTIAVSCKALDGNAALNPEKAAFVPSDGMILPQTEIECTEGDTVYDVLRRACKEHVCIDNCVYCQNGGIQIEAAYTPGYGTYYVEGIHQIYEKDCGSRSGWLFKVNGKTAVVGCSELLVHEGDQIEWIYTTDWNEND